MIRHDRAGRQNYPRPYDRMSKKDKALTNLIIETINAIPGAAPYELAVDPEFATKKEEGN